MENLELFNNHSEHAGRHWQDIKETLEYQSTELSRVKTILEYEHNKKKSTYVYLAGNISDDPHTYGWRERFIKLVRNDPGLVVVNPCGNQFNQGMRGINKSSLEFIKEAKKRSQYLLRAKDYQMIKICNAMVVDLVTGTDKKPLIGTIQELCLAKDIFKIPVIAITHNEDTPYTHHPWIDECCSAKVDTVEESVEMIKTFFLEY